MECVAGDEALDASGHFTLELGLPGLDVFGLQILGVESGICAGEAVNDVAFIGGEHGLQRIRRNQTIGFVESLVGAGRRQINLEFAVVVLGMRHGDEITGIKNDGILNDSEAGTGDRRHVRKVVPRQILDSIVNRTAGDQRIIASRHGTVRLHVNGIRPLIIFKHSLTNGYMLAVLEGQHTGEGVLADLRAEPIVERRKIGRNRIGSLDIVAVIRHVRGFIYVLARHEVVVGIRNGCRTGLRSELREPLAIAAVDINVRAVRCHVALTSREVLHVVIDSATGHKPLVVRCDLAFRLDAKRISLRVIRSGTCNEREGAICGHLDGFHGLIANRVAIGGVNGRREVEGVPDIRVDGSLNRGARDQMSIFVATHRAVVTHAYGIRQRAIIIRRAVDTHVVAASDHLDGLLCNGRDVACVDLALQRFRVGVYLSIKRGQVLSSGIGMFHIVPVLTQACFGKHGAACHQTGITLLNSTIARDIHGVRCFVAVLVRHYRGVLTIRNGNVVPHVVDFGKFFTGDVVVDRLASHEGFIRGGNGAGLNVKLVIRRVIGFVRFGRHPQKSGVG